MNALAEPAIEACAERIRVRGLVQGVGFRPAVWKLAKREHLDGWVLNDAEGVWIHVQGAEQAIARFVDALQTEAPPLSRIDEVRRAPVCAIEMRDFEIRESVRGVVNTGVVPDAVSCPDCVAEIFDPFARRFRYPFTNCTNCGPRLSIVESIPYDRAGTTMRAFTLCPQCGAEYGAPDDRRFHAQPVACHTCGPRARLERADGGALAVDAYTMLDAVDAACTLLQRGQLLAIKGLGGYQLACDATNEEAVNRLRERKRRERKPFALMARDLEVIRRYCDVTAAAETLLTSSAGPIVVMEASGSLRVAEGVAPGVGTLGFMLPNTPLHHLMLRRMARPIVLTSGNLSDEPQCVTDGEARTRLGAIADFVLAHDRPIARRVDDSVVRVFAGASRILRRARGYAPAPLRLPPGFEQAPPVLALGGELKNSFCLLRPGEAIVSHHIGDLEEARTQADWRRAIQDYLRLFAFAPQSIAIDQHPEYHASKWGRELTQARGLELMEVQHHHAHIAACLAENGHPLHAGSVLGVALDGLGYGDDGQIWGGEFLLADYRRAQRLGTFKPVAMIGGEQAIREPWRNTYAHITAQMGWPRFAMNYGELDLFRFLEGKPRAMLDGMVSGGVNSPLASSCGRLFDAVAAAAGICRERALYEGQAAIEFEALVDRQVLEDEDEASAYPFPIPRLKDSGLPYIEPLAMWEALLGDLILNTPVPVIAARFHKGLAQAIARMVEKLGGEGAPAEGLRTVALSGGVFQNRTLAEQVKRRLESVGFTVLMHRHVPTNDGGLSLGQAAIAAARAMALAHLDEPNSA